MPAKKTGVRPAKPKKARRTNGKTEQPAIDRRKPGNAGYAGYEYQIDVTIWVALDLIFARDLADHVVIEPPSHEDIEAALNQIETTQSVSAVGSSTQISVQAKTRSKAPWTSPAFADVLLGKETGDKGRTRPLEMLKKDSLRRYVMVTNEATAETLRPHEGVHLLDFPETDRLPPNTRNGIAGAEQALLSPRILIVSNITREVLRGRIADLLMRHGHVASAAHDDCIEDLREAVRARMRGEHQGLLNKLDIVGVIARHGGSIQGTRAMDHYVQPMSYARIRERLDKQHAVIISGPSGTGKTLTADLIEYELRKHTPPYAVVTEKGGPGDVRAHLTDQSPTLFHLRDPWGSNRLEPGADRWSGELPKLLEQASQGRKFLVTSRSDVMHVAGAELLRELGPYIVRIEITDYGPAGLARIYDNLAADLSGPVVSYAATYRERALSALSRPYEISRFINALRREDAEQPRRVEEIIRESEIEAISNVIALQLQQFGPDGAAGVGIIWALLSAREAVHPSTFDKLMRRLRTGDPHLRPDVDGLIDFLVAGQNLRRDDTALSFYHPRVEDGLRKAFLRHRADTEEALSHVVTALLAWDEGSQDWGAETALGVLRATDKLDGFEVQIESAAQVKLDAYLNSCALSANRRRDFERALRDLASIGSKTNPPSLLARLLLEKGNDERETWTGDAAPPQISDSDKERIRADENTSELLRRFIAEVLPFSNRNYHRDLVPLLAELADGLADAYWEALDSVAGPGGPSGNMDVILDAVLSTGEGAFDRALARFARSGEEADAWLETHSDELYEAQEHAVDADGVDHILEEPSERFFNYTHGVELLVRSRWKTDTDLDFIASSPHRDLLLDALATILHSSIKPSEKVLRQLIELSTGWTRQKAWNIAARHWHSSLIELLRADLLREDIEEGGLRHDLIAAAAAAGDGGGELLTVLGQLLAKMSVSRRFELVVDIMKTRLDSDKGGKAGMQQRLERAVKLIAVFPAEEQSLADALAHLISEEDIRPLAAKLRDADRQLMAMLLPAMKAGELAPLTLLAAASGLDVSAQVGRLLATDDGFDGENALRALSMSNQQDLRARLAGALSHRRYGVRRRAFEVLAPDANATERARLLELAKDHSSDVRLAFAEQMANLKWDEALPALVELLGDTRNFNSQLGEPSWSRYAVARAAAFSLGAYESLPSEVVDALKRAASSGNLDPMVPAAAISALALSAEPGVASVLVQALHAPGIERAARYRPAAQAAAWAIFDRAVAGHRDVVTGDLIATATDDAAPVAGPILIALGIVPGSVRVRLLERLETKKAADRIALVRIAAAVAQSAEGLTSSEIERAISRRSEGPPYSQADQSLLESWSMKLLTDDGFERYLAWIAKVVLELPIKGEVADIRATDLPSRVPLLTLRSLTPYAEELGEDDGT